MGTITRWNSVINNQSYDFTYEKVKSDHVLTINGVVHQFKVKFLSGILGVDEGFMLDGQEVRFVIEKGKPDLAVNGVYLQSGAVYVKRPAWALVFAVLCLLIPVVSMGGALPFVFGIAGASLCMSVSRKPWTSVVRIIACIGITMIAWLFWFLLLLAVLN